MFAHGIFTPGALRYLLSACLGALLVATNWAQAAAPEAPMRELDIPPAKKHPRLEFVGMEPPIEQSRRLR